MTQTNYSDNVVIQGSRDVPQLEVLGNVTQTTPLENWRDNGTNIKAQITGDGRFQIGNNLGSGAPVDALIQANNDITLPSSLPLSGWHTLGRITGALSSAANWVVHELQLLGTGGVSGLQTAMRAKLTHNNTGTSTSAELRGADILSINQSGTSGARVGQVTGLRSTANNATGAYLDKASGVEAYIANDSAGNMNQASAFLVVPPINSGSIGTLYGLQISDLTSGGVNYALFTNRGLNRLGDQLTVLGSADRPQLIIRANPTVQSTDLQQWQDGSGSVLASVNSSGSAAFYGNTSGTPQVTVKAGASASPTLDFIDANATPNRWSVGEGYYTATDGIFFIKNRAAGVYGLAILSDTTAYFGGNVILLNQMYIKAQESGGTTRSLLRMNSANTVEFGSTANGMNIFANSATPVIQMDAVGLQAVVCNWPVYSRTYDSNNGVSTGLVLRHQLTGVNAGPGMGTRQYWQLDTTAGTLRDAAYFDCVWADGADASRRAQLNFYVFDATNIRTPMIMSTNGSAPTIGFLGAGPSPQQTGGALSAAGTYAANEQLMLNRVFSAMRTFGLLN